MPGFTNPRLKVRPSTGYSGVSRGWTRKENSSATMRILSKVIDLIMEPKQPFLKGKLTAISVAAFVVSQLPEILSDLQGAGSVFQDAANAPMSVLALVAAGGTIWGAGRRLLNYFGR